MVQPFQEPSQELSDDTSFFDNMEVFNHVIQTVLNINRAEVVSLQNWMKYLGYNNFVDLQIELKDFHSHNAIELTVNNVPCNFMPWTNSGCLSLGWGQDEITPAMFHYDNFLLLNIKNSIYSVKRKSPGSQRCQQPHHLDQPHQ